MIDDACLEDPGLRRRWDVLRARMEEHSEALLTQGSMASKATPSGRVVVILRWVDRSGDRPVHRCIYVGDDGRLIGLVRRQLEHYRMLGNMPEEVAAHARIAATASFAARCLAAGRPRRRRSRA